MSRYICRLPFGSAIEMDGAYLAKIDQTQLAVLVSYGDHLAGKIKRMPVTGTMTVG